MFTASKYKNTKPVETKKELWYDGLRTSTHATEGPGAAVSTRWLAVVWERQNGGSVGVLDVSKPGRFDERDIKLVCAHSSSVHDLQFSPFDDNMLATASDDGMCKVWKLPAEGALEADITDAYKTLSGHARRVTCVQWHPVAEGVLATGSNDGTVRVWNVETERDVTTIDMGAEVTSISWCYNGSQLAVTAKDKTVAVVNPRSGSVLTRGPAHPGPKGLRVVWAGRRNQLFTVGVSAQRQREFAVWDSTDLSKPLARGGLDGNSGTLLPVYDADANVVYLAGKGDTQVRIVEVQESKPFFAKLNALMAQMPQKGVCVAPKRAVNVRACEIARLYRITKTRAEPVSMVVPRKTTTQFHPDIFPDTASNVPALDAEEWLDGKDAEPNQLSLRPGELSVATTPTKARGGSAAASSPVASATPVASAPSPTVSDALRTVIDGARTRAASTAAAPQFKNNVGYAYKQTTSFTHLEVDASKVTDASVIKTNGTFFAVPWKAGGGGKLGVFRLDKPGRVPAGQATISGHASAVLDFDFHPFDTSLLASSFDEHIKLWRIPEAGIESNMTECALHLHGEQRRVSLIKFHPYASNVLVASGDATVRLWDVDAQKERLAITQGHTDAIVSVDFNGDGTLMVTSCKDRQVRLLDPRAQAVASCTPGHAGAKAQRSLWLSGCNRVYTVGFSRHSEREHRLWDPRDMSKPLWSKSIDNSSGALIPYEDPDTNIVYLAGKGDSTIRFYYAEEGQCVPLNSFRTTRPQVGVAMLPKKSVNVREVEVARFLKVVDSGKGVEQIGFRVPRTRPQYFQDDVFVDTWDGNATSTAEAWFAGSATHEPTMMSLQPEDMEKLSLAPPEAKKKSSSVLLREAQARKDSVASSTSSAAELDDAALDDWTSRMGGTTLSRPKGEETPEWDDDEEDDWSD